MPSEWLTAPVPKIISEQQVEALAGHIQARLRINVGSITGMQVRDWRPISRQIYADVEKNGKRQRIEAFNANYGLNRGLCAAALALSVVALEQKEWVTSFGLFVVAAVYLYRARRFGVHYARELFVQFLQLPPTPSARQKPKPYPRAREPKSEGQ
jgi:hypothetical protein